MKRKWVRTSVPLGETRPLRLGDVRMESYGEKLTEVLAEPGIPKRREVISLILHLGLPAVLAEVSTTVMQYIDTAMVGSLGANASAAIGVVQTTTWLLFGCCECAALGFSIQVAQFLGAGKDRAARDVACQGLVVCGAFSLVIAFVGMALSKSVPRWLGGPAGVLDDAAGYFFFMSAFMPVVMLQRYGALMLQCTGDMATPSIINVVSCFLDVVFNFLLIMPGAVHSLGGVSVFFPGAGMGVRGAAAGTGVATAAAAFPMLWFVFWRSGRLSSEGSQLDAGEALSEKCACPERTPLPGTLRDERRLHSSDHRGRSVGDHCCRCQLDCDYRRKRLLHAGVWPLPGSHHAGGTGLWLGEA